MFFIVILEKLRYQGLKKVHSSLSWYDSVKVY